MQAQPQATEPTVRFRPARTFAAGATSVLLAACSLLPPAPEPAPAPVLAPIVITAQRRLPAPVPEPEPAAPVAQPAPPAPPPPVEPETGRIAIVLSDRRPAYENVAVEIGRRLERFLLYNLADKSLAPPAAFSGIADSGAQVVIAVGLRAAEQAMLMSPLPVVFCQVFNVDVSESAVPVRGVAAIPPLAPQVRAWKRAHPGLGSIGAILGPGHEALIEEAETAAASEGIRFQYRIAASDRETLYLFHRMAREIDGFWLFPDNRILSIPVLKDMLSYADRHDVQVAVFNPALVELGAGLAVTSDDADVAATAIAVAERIIAGELGDVPALTPLTRVDVRVATVIAAPAGAKGAR